MTGSQREPQACNCGNNSRNTGKELKMVTVKSIGQHCGYSRWDHLLDDGPLQDMIGRTYRDAAAAKRAANNIQWRRNCSRNCGRNAVPISITLDVCGDEVVVTT